MIIQKILERYLKEIKIPFILSSLLLFFILCIFGKCISHINNKDKQIIELQNYIIGLQEEKINLSNKILEQKEYIVTLENAEPKDFNLNNFTIEEQFKLASQIYNIDYKLNRFGGYKFIYGDTEVDLWLAEGLFSSMQYNVDGLYFDLRANSLLSLTFDDFHKNGLKLINPENNIENGREKKLTKFERLYLNDNLNKQ